MTEWQTQFDGETFDPKRDGKRLASQLVRVTAAMRDGQWHSLNWLVGNCGGSVASVSARLRDMRKLKFGGMTIERKYEGDGVWLYKLAI